MLRIKGRVFPEDSRQLGEQLYSGCSAADLAASPGYREAPLPSAGRPKSL